MQADLARRILSRFLLVGEEAEEVARLRLRGLGDRRDLGGLQELRDAALRPLGRELEPGEAFGPVGLRERLRLVDLLARQLGAAGHAETDDRALGRRRGRREHLERARLRELGDVEQLEPEPSVGLVASEPPHALVVGQPVERLLDRDLLELSVELDHQVLDHGEHVVLLDERHLHVELGELGLAVRAQVLVPQALAELEVAVEAADHQHLLEQLRALGKRVDHPPLDARRHDEVARPFGGRLHEERRFDLVEPVLGEHPADHLADRRPEHDVLEQRAAAEVDVAVLEAQLLAGLRLVRDLERRRLGAVQQVDHLRDDLDLPRRHLGVHRVGGAQAHLALDRDDELGPELGHNWSFAGVADDLREPVPVTDVQEDDAAVVAVGVDPAVQDHGLSGMIAAQLAARVGAFPGHGREEDIKESAGARA